MPTPPDAVCTSRAGERLRVPSVQTRLSIYNLDTLELVEEIAGVGGNGTAVDPKSGHRIHQQQPVSMFDTKTMKLIKSIDVGEAARPDGIYFDKFNERVYVFSHPTKDATVIDAKDGNVARHHRLGGVPEQGVGDGKRHALRRHAGCAGQCHGCRRQDNAGRSRTIPSGTRAGAMDWRWTRRTRCSSQPARIPEIHLPSRRSP